MQQYRRVFVKWILKRENAFVENVLTSQRITAFAEQMDHKNHEEIDFSDLRTFSSQINGGFIFPIYNFDAF